MNPTSDDRTPYTPGQPTPYVSPQPSPYATGGFIPPTSPPWLPSSEHPPTWGAPEPAPKKKSRLWLVFAVVAGIIVITTVVAITLGAKGGTGGLTGQLTEQSAQRACQEQFVPAQLKAPATAKYSGVTVAMTGTKSYGDEYTVTGSVDAENSFSALVRSTFTCVVLRRDGADQWALVSATVS